MTSLLRELLELDARRREYFHANLPAHADEIADENWPRMLAELKRLDAENERLRNDAERYKERIEAELKT